MLPAFPRPVSVLIGLGFPRRITGLREALTFLDEQPATTRDEAYEATCSTCRAAVIGNVPVEDAQEVFSAFARRRGILIEEASAEFANRAGEKRRSA